MPSPPQPSRAVSRPVSGVPAPSLAPLLAQAATRFGAQPGTQTMPPTDLDGGLPLALRPYAAGDGPLLARWLAEANLRVPVGLVAGRLDQRLGGDPHIVCRLAHLGQRGAGFYRLDMAPDGLAEFAAVVDPALRSRGVGRWLLGRAWDSLGERGGRGLLAFVQERNDPAVRFFTAAGFIGDGAVDSAGFLRFQRLR